MIVRPLLAACLLIALPVGTAAGLEGSNAFVNAFKRSSAESCFKKIRDDQTMDKLGVTEVQRRSYCECTADEVYDKLTTSEILGIVGQKTMPPSMQKKMKEVADDCMRKTFAGKVPATPNGSKGNASKDFSSVDLMAPFTKPEGFEYQGEIKVAPGIQAKQYSQSYERGGNLTINTFGVYEDQTVLKVQRKLNSSKSACQENVTGAVEKFQEQGLGGWKSTLREDDQVPVYEVQGNNKFIKISCRPEKSRWFLEMTVGVMTFQNAVR